MDTAAPPTSSLAQVAALFDPNVLLEIEAIAFLGDHQLVPEQCRDPTPDVLAAAQGMIQRVSRERLRMTFEEDAELYESGPDRGIRASSLPTLSRSERLPTAAQILEIGCGTGQATLPLAEGGYEITCVELGEQLAAVARGSSRAFRRWK